MSSAEQLPNNDAEAIDRVPLILGEDATFHNVSERVSEVVERKTPKGLVDPDRRLLVVAVDLRDCHR